MVRFYGVQGGKEMEEEMRRNPDRILKQIHREETEQARRVES